MLHWLKLQHSDWRANLVKDFFEINFPPIRAIKIITGHVIYNPAYAYKFKLKTTIEEWKKEINETDNATKFKVFEGSDIDYLDEEGNPVEGPTKSSSNHLG